jgi:DNA-binding transcriptional MerR regulator
MDKNPDAFRTIGEVAEDLDLPQHVLRFWETRFSQIRPMKRTGGRRYYRPDDVELVRAIKSLLYGQGYTIKGVQKLFKANGVRAVVAAAGSGQAIGPVQPALALELDETDEAAPALVGDGGSSVAQGSPLSGATAERFAALARELAECARILRAARA